MHRGRHTHLVSRRRHGVTHTAHVYVQVVFRERRRDFPQRSPSSLHSGSIRIRQLCDERGCCARTRACQLRYADSRGGQFYAPRMTGTCSSSAACSDLK